MQRNIILTEILILSSFFLWHTMLNLIELMYGVIFQYNKHYFWCLYYKLVTLFLHLIRFRSLFAQFNFETSTFYNIF